MLSSMYENYEKFNSLFYSVRREGVLLKSMTGSGSGHFILFKEGTETKEIEEIEELFRRKNCWTYITSLTKEPNNIEEINARI